MLSKHMNTVLLIYKYYVFDFKNRFSGLLYTFSNLYIFKNNVNLSLTTILALITEICCQLRI